MCAPRKALCLCVCPAVMSICLYGNSVRFCLIACFCCGCGAPFCLRGLFAAGARIPLTHLLPAPLEQPTTVKQNTWVPCPETCACRYVHRFFLRLKEGTMMHSLHCVQKPYPNRLPRSIAHSRAARLMLEAHPHAQLAHNKRTLQKADRRQKR